MPGRIHIVQLEITDKPKALHDKLMKIAPARLVSIRMDDGDKTLVLSFHTNRVLNRPTDPKNMDRPEKK